LRVAIEGPCCAGKTTLGHQLLNLLDAKVAWVADYADVVGGGRFLPPAVPFTVADEERALHRFLDIEAQRMAAAHAASDAVDLVLIDRSVHTLLAHCHALTQRNGTDFDGTARRVLRPSPLAVWPDLILYLDVGPDTIDRRNRGKFPPGSVFTDPDFNRAIRAYFATLADAGTPPVTWLDGSSDARLLADSARAAISFAAAASVHQEGL
jgi:thymidylate kinase